MATSERCPTCGHELGVADTYANERESMAYLRFTGTVGAFRQKVRRLNTQQPGCLPKCRFGNQVLFLRRDLDAVVQGRAQPLRIAG